MNFLNQNNQDIKNKLLATMRSQMPTDIGTPDLGKTMNVLNRGYVAGGLGGPVDLVNMLLSPVGLGYQKPVMGSEWIGDRMQDAGMVTGDRYPAEELLAGFLPGPGVIGGVLPKTVKLTREHILMANAYGIKNPSAFWSYYTPSLQIAFELGQKGDDLSSAPVVKGERYGSIPKSGISHNFMSDRSERGLSLANLLGEEEVGSSVWFAERPKVTAEGVLLPYKGSDGEPLILPFGVDYLD